MTLVRLMSVKTRLFKKCATASFQDWRGLSKVCSIHQVWPEVADLSQDGLPEGLVALEDEDGHEDRDDAGHNEVVVVDQVGDRLHVVLLRRHVTDLFDGDRRRRQAQDDRQVDAEAQQRLGVDAGGQALRPGSAQLVAGNIDQILFALVQKDLDVDERVKQDAQDLHDAVDPAN